jgi:hypothetical protein
MTSVALSRKRQLHDQRSSRGHAQASNRTTGPNFGAESNIGPFRKASDRAKEFAKVLDGIPVGVVASAAAVSKETARNWTQGKRFPHGDALLDLGTNLNVVRAYINARLDGHESPQVQQAVAQAEHALASLPPHQAALVRAQLSKACAQ